MNHLIAAGEQINLTLRRLKAHTNELEHTRISIAIQSEGVVYTAKSRTVKSRAAYFYGESFSLNCHIKQIVLRVLCDRNQQQHEELASFNLNTTQLTHRVNSFCVQSQLLSLTLEAHIAREHLETLETEFDDLQEFKPILRSPKNSIRKMYSPLPKAVEKSKKSSVRVRDQQARSENVSSSPHKMTHHTNDTFIRIKNNKPSPCRDRKKLIQAEERTEPVQPSFNLSHQKKVRRQFQMKEPMTPRACPFRQSMHLKKKKSQGFMSRVNLRSLIYTGVIGIISGVTAAQMQV